MSVPVSRSCCNICSSSDLVLRCAEMFFISGKKSRPYIGVGVQHLISQHIARTLS